MNADLHTRLGTRIPHHVSADFQSAVSQGFQPASRSTRRTHAVFEGLPLETGDTAGWKPALQSPAIAPRTTQREVPWIGRSAFVRIRSCSRDNEN